MRIVTDRRKRTECGVTLIELVVAVAIVGIIAAALLGVVLQYLKTTTNTQARLSESTDQQFISTYWQNDVSSLGKRSLSGSAFNVAQSVFVGTTGPGACGSAVGSPVVTFAWNEFEVGVGNPDDAWNSTPHEVAYVTVAHGSRLLLRRIRCRDGVEGAPVTVARSLTGTPTISCDTTCGAASPPNQVRMQFTVKDADNPDSPGYTTTVSGDRRQG